MNSEQMTELAEKAKKGDTKAFAQLYEMIYKKLYYYALANLRCEEDAADAVSDCVVEAFAQIKKLKKAEAFSSYMYAILSNKIKRKQAEYSKQCAATDHYVTDDVRDMRDHFAGVEIYDELAELTENERLCITLNCIAGYKGEEIAEITGIPHTTVRSHISRGKAKLKILETAE